MLGKARLITVLELLSHDILYKNLSVELGVTDGTFKRYVSEAYQRLNIHTARGLVAFYYERIHGKTKQDAIEEIRKRMDMGSVSCTSASSK